MVLLSEGQWQYQTKRWDSILIPEDTCFFIAGNDLPLHLQKYSQICKENMPELDIIQVINYSLLINPRCPFTRKNV